MNKNNNGDNNSKNNNKITILKIITVAIAIIKTSNNKREIIAF